MVRIPFTPTPYPDEALGSILTRFTIHNGDSVWRSIENALGLHNPNLSLSQRKPPHPATIEHIIKEIGFSLEDATSLFTIVPFLRLFNAARTNPLKLEYIRQPNRLFSSGFTGTIRKPGARFCPCCLEEDIATFGEPFLHRSHQIAASLVCTVHSSWLRTSCPSCDAIIVPLHNMVLPPLPVACSCGKDLRLINTNNSKGDCAYKRLSQFCIDALSLNGVPWSRFAIHSLAKQSLTSPIKNSTKLYKEILRHYYGEPAIFSSGQLTFTPLPGDSPLSANISTHRFTAEDYAILFSATYTLKELDIALAQIENNEENPACHRRAKNSTPIDRKIQTLSSDILSANNVLSDFSKRYPYEVASLFQRRHPRLYWLLRVHEPDSIKKFSPKLHQIPSIEYDRENLERLFNRGLTLQQIYTKQSRPLYRAMARDTAWLAQEAKEYSALVMSLTAEQVTIIGKKPTTHRAIGTPEKSKERHFQALRNQRDATERKVALSLLIALRAERRPEKITHERLSRISSTTINAVVRLSRPGSRLHKLIAKTNADKDRRMTLWAAQVLFLAGEDTTPASVLLVGGLNTTKKNRDYAISAIDQVSRGLRRKAVSSTYISDPEQLSRLRTPQPWPRS